MKVCCIYTSYNREQTFGLRYSKMENDSRVLNFLTRPQVADYCSERLHLALAEELGVIKEDLSDEIIGDSQQVQWEKAFTNCFQRVDDEIEGKVGRGTIRNDGDDSEASFEPLAPETVGSTAVVALVCSSHIIVANCGDSRAVLCRGKQAMPLSVDHKVSMSFWFTYLHVKNQSFIPSWNQSLFYFIYCFQPNREDEYARIEASGGKVIQWNGHRVFGVLAMSRSIGKFGLQCSRLFLCLLK